MPHTPKLPESPNTDRDNQRVLAEAFKKLASEGVGEFVAGEESQ